MPHTSVGFFSLLVVFKHAYNCIYCLCAFCITGFNYGDPYPYIKLFYETHSYFYNFFLNFIVAGIPIDFCQMDSTNGISSVLFQEFLKTWSLHYTKECLNTLILQISMENSDINALRD